MDETNNAGTGLPPKPPGDVPRMSPAAEAAAIGKPPTNGAQEAFKKEIVIDLVVPVQAHGDTVKKLVFRRPTGGDIMAMGEGYPIVINWATGMITPNPQVMGAMMATLAAVPPSTIRSLDAQDWSTCAHALMGFFPPGAQAMQS